MFFFIATDCPIHHPSGFGIRMSSLSLPRVLQPRKTSLELERETFEKFQSASIGKAVNSQENPVKEKHVRSKLKDFDADSTSRCIGMQRLLGSMQEKQKIVFYK